jgi:predicted DNA-binding transcriptional regulator YafY
MALEGARALLERLSEMEEATAVPSLSSREEAWRDLLMQAIQNGRTLELIYAHPSAERPTQYRILPLRWIPRGRGRSSPMVLAIDLARGEERNFRLDRILELHEG